MEKLTNDKYSCKCGKLTGVYNAAKQCPECGRLCINRDELECLKREDSKLAYESVSPVHPQMMPQASNQFGVHPSWEYAFRFDQNIFVKAKKIRENPKAIYAVLDFEDPETEMTEETAELTECYLDTVYALLDRAKELGDEAKDINDKTVRLAMMMQTNPKVYELVQRYLSDDMTNFIMAKTRRKELAEAAIKNADCTMFKAFCQDIDNICSNYQDKISRVTGSFNILNNIKSEGNAEIIHLDEYFTAFANKLYTAYIAGNDKLAATMLAMTWDMPQITYPLIYGGGTVTNMVANTIIFMEDCALALTDKENINYPFIMNVELNDEWRYISGGAYVTFVDCILRKSKELGGTSNASSGEETKEHAGSEMSEDI